MSGPLADPQDVAVQHARDALARAPQDGDAWHALAWALEQRGDLDEAVTCYRDAVRFNPRADGSWNNLANCLNAQGRFEDAYEAWRVAIRLAPTCALYYRNLVQSKTLTLDDPCFTLLEQQVAHVALRTRPEQADLHFAYGQALTGIGERERGFAHFSRANALYRHGVNYNEAVTLGLFGQLPELFTPALLGEKGGRGAPAASPVFIVGMPRSGSTLVEQILASHPDACGVGERPDFGQVLAHAFTDGLPDGLGRLSLETLPELSGAQLAALGDGYLQRIARVIDGGDPARYRRVADKYPYNFIHAGFIHLALPNARIIHTRRAPLETCLSIYSRCFRDVPFGYDLGELGRYYRAYDALMAHWRAVLPPETFLEVRYEDLVDDLEGQVRRMLAHCGLGWDERCLAFHQTERQVTTASAAQVRRPLYRTSVRRWRPDAAALRPLLDGLGPELAADETAG